MDFEERMEKRNKKRAEIQKVKGDFFQKSMYEKHLFSTGIYRLDQALNGGGVFGKIIEIFGEQSSGKTSLAFKIAEQINLINYDTGEFDPNHANSLSTAFLDIEQSFDSDWARQCGFDEDLYGNSADEVLGGDTCSDIVQSFIDDDLYSCIIVDSLDAFYPVALLDEGDSSTNDTGLRAKTLYRAVRKWVASYMKSYRRNKGFPWRVPVIILLNHSVPIFMDQWGRRTSPGGAGAKFYSGTRIELSKLKIQTENVKEFGMGNFKATIKKNKTTGQAGRIAEWQMALKDFEQFEAGYVDNVKPMFADLKDYELLTKDKTKYHLFGEEYKTQTEVKERMYAEPDFEEKVRKELIKVQSGGKK